MLQKLGFFGYQDVQQLMKQKPYFDHYSRNSPVTGIEEGFAAMGYWGLGFSGLSSYMILWLVTYY